MRAADPLQQQTGHLCLPVELGLCEPQLVLRLQTGRGSGSTRQEPRAASAAPCLHTPLAAASTCSCDTEQQAQETLGWHPRDLWLYFSLIPS